MVEGFLVYEGVGEARRGTHWAMVAGIQGMPHVVADVHGRVVEIDSQPIVGPDAATWGPLLVPADRQGEFCEVPSPTFARPDGCTAETLLSRPFIPQERIRILGISVDRDDILTYERNRVVASTILGLLKD